MPAPADADADHLRRCRKRAAPSRLAASREVRSRWRDEHDDASAARARGLDFEHCGHRRDRVCAQRRPPILSEARSIASLACAADPRRRRGEKRRHVGRARARPAQVVPRDGGRVFAMRAAAVARAFRSSVAPPAPADGRAGDAVARPPSQRQRPGLLRAASLPVRRDGALVDAVLRVERLEWDALRRERRGRSLPRLPSCVSPKLASRRRTSPRTIATQKR